MAHLAHRVLKVSAVLGLALLATMTTAHAQSQTDSSPETVEQEFLSRRWVEVAQAQEQPPMLLPWREGEAWTFTTGPHGANLAAIDFAPPSGDRCFSGEHGKISDEFVLATAPGVIIRSTEGEVVIDHDGDGDLDTGWQSVLFHMSDEDRIPVGTRVNAGDRLGRVDCVYGYTDGTHLHFARTREGRNVSATDQVAPLNLSGWRFGSYGNADQDWATSPTGQRVDLYTEITSDNGPARQLELFGSQPELANLGLLFRIPGTLFKPKQVIDFPEVGGAFTKGRLKGENGMLLPVASQTLSSDEDDHLGRGSINAWDLSTVYEAPIYPAHSGTVTYAGCNNSGNYGCWVEIKGDDGLITQYAHMINERTGKSDIPVDSAGNPQGFVMVRKDQRVTQWTPLGRVGRTGKTGWTHVHFVVKSGGQHIPVSSYFDATNLEYRPNKEALDWPWDEPYQANHPIEQSPPITQHVRPEQTRGLGIILVVVLFMVTGSLFMKSRQPVRRFWLLEGVRLGFVYSVAAFVAIFLIFGVSHMFEGGLPFPGLRIPRFTTPVQAMSVQIQPGSVYTPVWGWPCSNGGPGTLGTTCTSEEIVNAAKSWASAVSQHTGKATTPVAIPVKNAQFSWDQAAQLIQEAHAQGVLVILDTSGKEDVLMEAIRDLTPYGLDGIAVDHEHNESLGFAEINRLGKSFASARQQAGLRDNGILLVWDVFHNISGNIGDFQIPGITSVVIMDGFGSIAAKQSSLAQTRNLFGVSDSQLGVMFFDRRWPINSSCQDSSNTNGYDCQSWKTMYDAASELHTLGWLAQQ